MEWCARRGSNPQPSAPEKTTVKSNSIGDIHCGEELTRSKFLTLANGSGFLFWLKGEFIP
jgi:hypothetical protein